MVGSTFFCVWGLYDDVNRKLSTLQIKTYKLRRGGQRVGGILYALLEKRLTEPQNGGCYPLMLKLRTHSTYLANITYFTLQLHFYQWRQFITNAHQHDYYQMTNNLLLTYQVSS